MSTPTCAGEKRKFVCGLCGRLPEERCARVAPPTGRPCPGCEGSGEWNEIDCPVCEGSGRVGA